MPRLLRLALVLALSCSILPGIADAQAQQAPQAERAAQAKRPDYQFSEDWFSRAIPIWQDVLVDYRGKPGIRYLEIGVHEGRSLLWMLDNVLTHPSTRAWAADIFYGPYYATFLRNLAISGHLHQVDIVKGDSRLTLRELPVRSFDIVYIDGSHDAEYVLSDAMNGWALLKPGGLLMFDDYQYAERFDFLPDQYMPTLSIDAFTTIYADSVEVVHDGYQKVLRKLPNPCGEPGCSLVGSGTWNWYTKQWQRLSDRKPVALSRDEVALLERFLRTRVPGDPRYAPEPGLLRSPEWRALAAKLGLDAVLPRILMPEEQAAKRRKQAEAEGSWWPW